MVVTHSLKAKTLRFTGKSFRFHEFTIKHMMSWLENKNPNLKEHLKCNIFLQENHCKVYKCRDGLIWVTETNPYIVKGYTISLKGSGCTPNGCRS